MENYQQGGSGFRATIIREIQSPLALYALIVLVVEGILIFLATKAKGLDITLLVVGMLAILGLLILNVTNLTSKTPIRTSKAIHDQRIVHASANRGHSQGKGTYWDQARASVSIFAPTLWKSIMGLTDSATSDEVESLKRVAQRLRGKLRILLLDPKSPSFDAHRELLSTTGDIGDIINAQNYANKLSQLEKILLDVGAQLRYYRTYPTVSFVVVDDCRVKVDYVLPHRRVKQRPLIEFEKGDGQDLIIFDVFLKTFEAVWNDPKTTSAPPVLP